MLSAWREQVKSESHWQAHSYEGYKAVAVDLTGFFRPRLRGWLGQAYNGLLGKASRGVSFGMIAEIGSIDQQRLALPRKLLRSKNEANCEKALKTTVLNWLAKHLQKNEVAILDAGFNLVELQSAGVAQFVVRQASNCTARRNYLAAYKGRGARPKYGELIRPLARTHKGHSLSARQPDETTSFVLEGRSIHVHRWHELVRSDQNVSQNHPTFSLRVFFDPVYQQPLVLAVDLPLKLSQCFCFTVRGGLSSSSL